jgi:uncharacterized protein (TIGR02996 family)
VRATLFAVARFERDGEVFEITSESGAYHAQQRRHLAAGWTRVHDPRCEEPLDGEPRDPTLEAALRADPFDAAVVLVYADWLQQRGHPRGALIAVQHQLAGRPGDGGLRDEERRLLDDAEALMSRPLVTHLAMRRARPGQPSVELAASRSMYGGGTVIWDHGFLREASLELRRRGADEDLLWELLRHPSARFLTALELRVARDRDLALAAALLLGVLWGAGSVATERPGTPEPTTIVQVAPGDTLYEIAAEVTVDGDVAAMVERIQRLNALDTGMLQAGQRIRVPITE